MKSNKPKVEAVDDSPQYIYIAWSGHYDWNTYEYV